MLKFDRDKVTSLDLSNSAGDLQFVKSGTEWKIAKPIAARADFGADRSDRRASAFASDAEHRAPDGTADLKKYGLDKPTGTITVGSGSARATTRPGKH